MYAETQAGTPAPATPATPALPRKTAKALSLVRYQSDQPCKRGDLSPRFTSTGHCVECLAAHTKARRAHAKEVLRLARLWFGGYTKVSP